MAMLSLAAASDPRLHPSDVEVLRAGPSYMVDTLRDLRAAQPDEQIYLILGLDAYLDIDTWKEPGTLLSLAHIVVTTRPGGSVAPRRLVPPVAAQDACCYDSSIGCHLHRSGNTLRLHHLRSGINVSASTVRERVRRKQPIAELVGNRVAAYIADHHLYLSNA
jgi:nicotinate-nucleotide adenylyltransferase